MQNILLVEDNESDVILSRMEIKRWGFPLERLDVARSLTQARALMSVKEYSQVFLDYELPDGQGTDLIKEIDLEKTTVTILSGHTDADHITGNYDGDLSGVNVAQKPLQESDAKYYWQKMQAEDEAKKKYKKLLRARCIAFWSVASAVAGIIGNFLVEHSAACRAGFKAFITVLMSK